MPSPRLAYVGPADRASPWLLRALRTAGTFEAICDEHAERDVGKVRARWAYEALASLLKEAEPDGIVLQRPVAERSRLIKQCLAAGAGVLLAGTPGSGAACKRLSSLAAVSGRVVLAAPPVRFSPALRLAHRLLQAGRLSEPIGMTLRSTWPRQPGKETTGQCPVSTDQVFEAADVVHHLLGPVARAFGSVHAEGVLMAHVVTTAGAPVALSMYANGPAEAVGLELELRTAEGAILRVDRDGRLACSEGSKVIESHQTALATADPAVELGYAGLLAEFCRGLQAGGTGVGLVGPVPAVAAATEAILASAAKGRPVAPRAKKGGQATFCPA